ncbi:MAG TPA: hypothetical protein V6D23_06970, partial [Candidatus Obscuribacterales bacterium]
MAKLSGKLTHLALTASLLGGLWALPARASLDQTLAPFPDDTVSLVSVSLDPAHWSYLIERVNQVLQSKPGTSPEEKLLDPELPPEFDQLLRFLMVDMEFDPVRDGLFNLGSHLSLAYRPQAGSSGHFLFSLNLRSPDRVEALIQRLRARLAKDGDNRKLTQEAFGPAKIYTLNPDLTENPPESTDFDEIHFAVSGHNLIGSLGSNPDLIKRMLYTDSVLPADSRFRLNNQASFEPVRDYLKDQAM